jgi:hypothetical protein
MSKSSYNSLKNSGDNTWKTNNSIKLPKKSIKHFSSSFEKFFDERITQQEEMAQNKRGLRKNGSLQTISSSYGSEDEDTTRYLQGINLRKTKGGKRRRTRNSRKTVRRRRR